MQQEEIVKSEDGTAMAAIYYSAQYKRYVVDTIRPQVERKTFVNRDKAKAYAHTKVKSTMELAASAPNGSTQETPKQSRWDVLRRNSSRSSLGSSSRSSLGYSSGSASSKDSKGSSD